MSTATVRISAEEQQLLRALSVGQNISLPSAHRLRLELIGLLRDGPKGPRLTEKGMRYAQVALVEEGGGSPLARSEVGAVKRDRLGRRMPHVRALPFD